MLVKTKFLNILVINIVKPYLLGCPLWLFGIIFNNGNLSSICIYILYDFLVLLPCSMPSTFLFKFIMLGYSLHFTLLLVGFYVWPMSLTCLVMKSCLLRLNSVKTETVFDLICRVSELLDLIFLVIYEKQTCLNDLYFSLWRSSMFVKFLMINGWYMCGMEQILPVRLAIKSRYSFLYGFFCIIYDFSWIGCWV